MKTDLLEEQEDAHFIVCKVIKRVWTSAWFLQNLYSNKKTIYYIYTNYLSYILKGFPHKR